MTSIPLIENALKGMFPNEVREFLTIPPPTWSPTNINSFYTFGQYGGIQVKSSAPDEVVSRENLINYMAVNWISLDQSWFTQVATLLNQIEKLTGGYRENYFANKQNILNVSRVYVTNLDRLNKLFVDYSIVYLTPSKFIVEPEPVVEPTPETIPVGFHKMPDGTIMKNTEMYIVEDDGLVRMVRLGAVEYTEIKVFPENVADYISRGISRLLTEQERQPVIAPVTFCVNVYTLDIGGNVLSEHFDSISAETLQELTNQGKYIFLCKDGIIPTEQQVRQFYGFTEPVIDSSINTTMVSQSVGAFILREGKLTGEILYIANNQFNPTYYNSSISSIVEIKTKSGIPLIVKENILNFTQTQRDERIQIDEGVGNFKELIINFYVWKSTNDIRAFTETKQIQIVEEPETTPDDPDKFQPCPIGFHKDFSGKCVSDDPIGETPPDKLINTLKGFLFGTVALSLLARKY